MDLRDKYRVSKNIFSETTCPVCGKRTLDSFRICENCNWEEDGTTDENEYSSANSGTIREYRDNFGKSKVKMLYVVTANEPPSSEAYEESVSILKDAFEPVTLYQNIYYSEQKEKYKAYLFVAWPI